MPQCLLHVIQVLQSKRQAIRETIHITSRTLVLHPSTQTTAHLHLHLHMERRTQRPTGGKKQHPVQETDPPPQAYENPQLSETPNPEGNVSMMDEDDDIQHSRSA